MFLKAMTMVVIMVNLFTKFDLQNLVNFCG